jgi:predicted ATPase
MRLVGHWAMGVTKLYVGEPAAALAHLSLMASLYDPARPAPALLFATDPGVACRFWSAWALWLLGRPDEALSSSYEALARAEQLDHPFSMAYALFTGTALLQFRREAQQAMGWAEATTTLAARYGFSYFQGLGTVFCGWAIAEQGRLDEGTALMEQGVAAARATGARIGLPHMLALLAEAYGRRGDPQRGLRLLDEALSLAETTGEQHYAAELHRLCGELLLAASHDESRHEQAERWLRRAVGLARSQGARALELRALISLCRLLAAAGRLEDELRALEACSDAFVEGAATADLREAHALIEQLRPAHAA